MIRPMPHIVAISGVGTLPFADQTTDNALPPGSERLIGCEVSPRRTTLPRIHTTGFGFLDATWDLRFDSGLQFTKRCVDATEVFVERIREAERYPLNAVADFLVDGEILRPQIINRPERNEPLEL